jgi:hypothetical protein
LHGGLAIDREDQHGQRLANLLDFPKGWVAERFNAPVLKTGVPPGYRGFESLPIR